MRNVPEPKWGCSPRVRQRRTRAAPAGSRPARDHAVSSIAPDPHPPDRNLEPTGMPTTLADMPFHARLAGSKVSESPLGKLIFEHEAQVVADHDAGRITDAEFDVFYQKASENIDRLYDLHARSVEADQEFREVTSAADRELDAALPGFGAEVFRVSEETSKVGLEAASEKNAATSGLQHGWVEAARELIELRSSFDNADAAALDRDRTLVSEREQTFDATDARYEGRIAAETAKADRHLGEADKLAEFERRHDEVQEKVKESNQELATFDRRIEEAKADTAGIDPQDPDRSQSLAGIDQRVAELRSERFEHVRASHETLDVEVLQQLESNKDYLTTLAQPGLESSDAAVRETTRSELNKDLANAEQLLAEHREDMAARSSDYAAHDAAMAQIAAKHLRIEELEQLKERDNTWAEANREKLDEYRRSNTELKQEIDAVNTELMQHLKAQAAEEESRTAEVAGRLGTRLTDNSADASTEPAARDQESIDRLADIDRLEATVAELREKLLDQMDAQIREQETIKLEHGEERETDALRAADVRAGVETGSAHREPGGAGGDAGSLNGASDQSAVIDAELYVDGAVYDDAEYPDVVYADVDVSIADADTGGDGPNGANGQSSVIEAELYVDAEHPNAADPDVEMSIADRSPGVDTDSSGSA